jgi:hypothetical protein
MYIYTCTYTYTYTCVITYKYTCTYYIYTHTNCRSGVVYGRGEGDYENGASSDAWNLHFL